ncbi:MAG: hypothetical protein AB1568_06120 [Thermodesulfobacteriota bacterium]
MASPKPIPSYTRIGMRVTAVLLVVLGVFLARNCSRSVYYGLTTPENELDSLFQRGYEEGLRQGRGESTGGSGYESGNPGLENAYQKGFRKGWDEGRSNRQ